MKLPMYPKDGNQALRSSAKVHSCINPHLLRSNFCQGRPLQAFNLASSVFIISNFLCSNFCLGRPFGFSA